MPSKTQHNSMQSSTHSKDHRHHRRSTRSSTLLSHNGSSQFSNDNTFHRRSVSPPSPTSMHYSAYFISRIDLDDYTEHTLKQTVDNVVAGSKIKGLKVKLIFPDEGLIVDNIIDPNQSWMYKASELLYFWRDPYYSNIIVGVTSNRLRPTATGPYSASIFRLRGDGLVQLFFQRAQQFFGQHAPPSGSSTNNSKVLIEKSTTVDNLPPDNQKKKSKHHSMTNKPSTSKSARSLQATPVRQGARTEFDPARTKTKTRNSIFNLYDNNRTGSESALLHDSRSKSSKRRSTDLDNDDKVTSISVHLSGEHVAELMRELKELRNEIASLKLEARFTPVRSTSTSPMTLYPENALNSNNSLSTSMPTLASQPGHEGEKSTGQNSGNHRSQPNDVSLTSKRKNEQSNTIVNKRPSSSSSNNNESDKEEPALVNFSDTNTSLEVLNSSNNRDDNSSSTFPLRPRPIKSYPHSFSHLSSSTYNLLSSANSSKSTPNDDDSTSITIPITKSLSVKQTEIVSFRTAIENTVASPDHTYENLPMPSPNEPTKLAPDARSQNETEQQQNKQEIYVNAVVERDLDNQPTSDVQKGVTLVNTHEPTLLSYSPSSLIRDTLPAQTTELPSNMSPRPQPPLFANRLTNPAFSVDRQLLANTIANQFDLHLNSPYLQKLIENQHLFVSQKRTYANMIWQMTPDEENAICTTPAKTIPNVVDSNRFDPNSSTAKSILKQHKQRTMQKKQRITWDNKLE
ncbi:unnamed protein product [Adineta ricciae]|uniref:Uncharacterized protein n=1 Tax=Adineta ricciae TaxID=249248 RepID=A0A816C3E3_ADIRI|nr:unnamed protein product [Adineta ricciae]